MALPASPSVRLVLIDDHEVVRTGLRMLIESRPGWQVVGEAATGSEAQAAVAREQPDMIVLDLDLGGKSGLDFLAEVLATAPTARVLILTGVRDPDLHRRAVHLGALGLVMKENAAAVLLEAIEKVAAGEIWLEPALTARVLREMTRPRGAAARDPEAAKIALLTPREREVIPLIGEGLKNQQIAKRLFISEATVRHHLTSIFAKLGVADRLELLAYAYRNGLTKNTS